jgi:hypothetical protein
VPFHLFELEFDKGALFGFCLDDTEGIFLFGYNGYLRRERFADRAGQLDMPGGDDGKYIDFA